MGHMHCRWLRGQISPQVRQRHLFEHSDPDEAFLLRVGLDVLAGRERLPELDICRDVPLIEPVRMQPDEAGHVLLPDAVEQPVYRQPRAVVQP